MSDPLAADLREALDRGRLELHYQPEVAFASLRTVGTSALARWRHPAGDWVPPARFVGIAEEAGLMKPLTEWVLGTALRQCRSWHDRGLDLYVSVNLSASNVADPRLTEQVAAQLRALRVRPAALRLEIAERTIDEAGTNGVRALYGLRSLDVGVRVDDFGVGTEASVELEVLGGGEIKLSRSVVGACTVADGRLRVERIVAAARRRGVAVVAEGIEDAKTWERLRELGCDTAIGFHIARPMPATDLAEWLARGPHAPLGGRPS